MNLSAIGGAPRGRQNPPPASPQSEGSGFCGRLFAVATGVQVARHGLIAGMALVALTGCCTYERLEEYRKGADSHQLARDKAACAVEVLGPENVKVGPTGEIARSSGLSEPGNVKKFRDCIWQKGYTQLSIVEFYVPCGRYASFPW